MTDLEREYQDFPRVVNCRQAGEMIGIDPSNVTRIARTHLQGWRVGDNRKSPFRFLKSTVIEYIQKRRSNNDAMQ